MKQVALKSGTKRFDWHDDSEEAPTKVFAVFHTMDMPRTGENTALLGVYNDEELAFNALMEAVKGTYKDIWRQGSWTFKGANSDNTGFVINVGILGAIEKMYVQPIEMNKSLFKY